MRVAILVCSMTTALATLPPPALAAETPGRPATLKQVTNCLSIHEDMARLACYDTNVKALDEAATRRDVVVVDKAQVRATRRTLFGLSVPPLAIFGGHDGKNRKDEEEDEIKEITAKAKSAQPDAYGNWIIVLDDGARWHQTDNQMIVKEPHAGSNIVIKRGALRSFVLKVDGQPGVKARREN